MLIGDGTEVYGTVENSVIGDGVRIGSGAVVKDSIVMDGARICEGAYLDHAIVAENAVIGERSQIGVGEDVPNRINPKVYSFGLAVIGEDAVVPPDVRIGKNTAVTGETNAQDYPGGALESGGILDKAGVVE